MKHIIIIFIFTLLGFCHFSKADDQLDNKWTISNISYYKKPYPEDNSKYEVTRTVVHFSNGKNFEIPLFFAKPLAILRAADGTNYLLAEGMECVECDAYVGPRFFKLTEGKIDSSDKYYDNSSMRYDRMNENKLTEEIHVYYGQCLNEIGDVLVTFRKHLDDHAKWQDSNTVVRLSKAGDVEVGLTLKDGTKNSVLEAIKTGKCKEIPAVKEWEPL